MNRATFFKLFADNYLNLAEDIGTSKCPDVTWRNAPVSSKNMERLLNSNHFARIIVPEEYKNAEQYKYNNTLAIMDNSYVYLNASELPSGKYNVILADIRCALDIEANSRLNTFNIEPWGSTFPKHVTATNVNDLTFQTAVPVKKAVSTATEYTISVTNIDRLRLRVGVPFTKLNIMGSPIVSLDLDYFCKDLRIFVDNSVKQLNFLIHDNVNGTLANVKLQDEVSEYFVKDTNIIIKRG